MTFAQAYRLWKITPPGPQKDFIAEEAKMIFSRECAQSEQQLKEYAKEVYDRLTELSNMLHAAIKADAVKIIQKHINNHDEKKNAAMAVKMALGEEVIQELTPEWVRSEFLKNWNKKQLHGNDNNT